MPLKFLQYFAKASNILSSNLYRLHGLIMRLYSAPPRARALILVYAILTLSILLAIFIMRTSDSTEKLARHQLLLSDIEEDIVVVGGVYEGERGEKGKMGSAVSNNIPTSIVSKATGNLRPKIALIAAGLGLNEIDTTSILSMDSRIALGFSPYARNLGDWVAQAISYNHEVFINIPMQSKNYPNDDMGPLALLSGLSAKDNIVRLSSITSKLNSITGLYSGPHEVFTSYRSKLPPVFDYMKSKKVLYVHGNQSNNATLSSIAREMGLNYVGVDIILDDTLSAENIKINMLRLDGMARVRGMAVGMFSTHPLSIRLISEWLKELNANGIELITMVEAADMRAKAISLAPTPPKKKGIGTSEFAKRKKAVDNAAIASGKIYSEKQYNESFEDPKNISPSSRPDVKGLDIFHNEGEGVQPSN